MSFINTANRVLYIWKHSLKDTMTDNVDMQADPRFPTSSSKDSILDLVNVDLDPLRKYSIKDLWLFFIQKDTDVSWQSPLKHVLLALTSLLAES